jgi:hypothetical protein
VVAATKGQGRKLRPHPLCGGLTLSAKSQSQKLRPHPLWRAEWREADANRGKEAEHKLASRGTRGQLPERLVQRLPGPCPGQAGVLP